MGWTGGQYSLYRMFLGLVIFVSFLRLSLDQAYFQNVMDTSYPGVISYTISFPPLYMMTMLVGGVFSIRLLLGAGDRIAAWVLFFLYPWAEGAPYLLPPVSFLLLLHLFSSPEPYLSFGARARIDPRGEWSLKPVIPKVAILYLVAACLACFVYKLHDLTTYISVPYFMISLGLILYIVQKGQINGWLLFLSGISWLIIIDTLPPDFLLLLMIAFQPIWLRSQTSVPEYVFYDGYCGLCHRSIRFLLSEDEKGDLFMFSPLQGEAIKEELSQEQIDNLPDSVAVLTSTGTVLIRSAAAVHALIQLGGYWRILGWIAYIIPVPIRNTIYRAIAAVRHKVFKQPEETCPLFPPDLRSRFLI